MTNSSVHTLLRYTFSKVLHHLGNWYNSFLNSSLNNYKLRNVFICPFTIPLFVSARLKRTHCFLSLIRTDSNVKMHLTEAIHSWLAMAPRREHSPHNNELLRLPEDTMPVQRIEIKRQVRCEEDGWGKRGSGGFEFNIQETYCSPECMKRSSVASKCWIKVPIMGIKLQLKRCRYHI